MARLKRRTKRFFLRVLMAIPFVLLAMFFYLWLRPPSRGVPFDVKVSTDPAAIKRGEYLFTAVSGCDACHSERDFSKVDAPVVPSGRGKGQVMDFRDLPGRIVASNITPDPETGLGSWTDGEKIRAIREGISKDGRALFPLMPYPSYRVMSDEDVEALVSFMNTLPPIKNALPTTSVSFPASMWMKGLPRPVGHVPSQDEGGGEIYGDYLANIGGCTTCHSQERRLEPDPNLLYAGGRLFAMPQGVVNSANLTPDKQTGIGTWNYQKFAARMQSFREFGAGGPPPAKPDQLTVMDWEGYSKMEDHDLESLFLYLKALKPVNNAVEVHPGGR